MTQMTLLALLKLLLSPAQGEDCLTFLLLGDWGKGGTSATVYNNQAYVAQFVPNNSGVIPQNTIIRKFDFTQSTSTQPFATDIFTVTGNVKDMSIADTGLGGSILSVYVDIICNSYTTGTTFGSTAIF